MCTIGMAFFITPEMSVIRPTETRKQTELYFVRGKIYHRFIFELNAM